MSRKYSWLVALAGMAAACSDATGPQGDHQLQVNVQVVNGEAVNVSSLSAASAVGSANAIDLESAVFVLGGLKLETAGLDETVDWVFEESVVVPLAFDGTPTLAFDTDVPPGIYKELEVSVDKLEVGNSGEEPLIEQWPDLADASILIEGTFTPDGGAPESFAFTAPLDIDLELLFDAPVEFTAEENPTTVVSLMIDVSGWFAGTGEILDPTDAANRSAIESNVKASVELHEQD